MILWCFDLKKHSFLAAFTQQYTNNPWAQGQGYMGGCFEAAQNKTQSNRKVDLDNNYLFPFSLHSQAQARI